MSRRCPADLETIIGGILRWGVAASLVLLGGGTLLTLLHPADATHGMDALLQRHPLGEYTRAWFVDGLCRGRGDVLILPGLALLIATPVFRVFVSIIAFAIEKDRVYVAITSLVLALLIFSMVLGKAG